MTNNPSDAGAFFRPAGKTDLATLKAYLETLFPAWDSPWWDNDATISVLGVGEKGVPGKEGVFRERKFLEPRSPFMLAQAQAHLDRWGQNGIASFIVPAILAHNAEVEGDVKLDKVKALTAIVVDIDSGDTEAKLDHAREWLGDPTMLVHSGGTTEAEAPKQHAYWMLDEPCTGIAEVARLRKLLAAKIGGDQSFQRATQVIRIPGSIYGKGGAHKPVRIVAMENKRWDLWDIREAIENMEWMDGCMPTVLPMMQPAAGGQMDFSAGAGVDLHSLATALTVPVSEGGDDRNRWSVFNQVAGHYIHCARIGQYTVEEARERTHGWMVSSMQPAWDEPRFAQEWTGLLNKDVAAHGPMTVPTGRADAAQQFGLPEPAAHRQGIEKIESADDLLSWAVINRSSENPAPRIDMVENMVVAGQRHLLVSEGGAGKTFSCMDLALKIASSGPEWPTNFWLGQRITEEAYGKTVVMFTAEDNQAALDRRWKGIDPDMKLRRRAGDRLIVIPMDNIGGSFPLVMHKPHGGGAVMATPEWAGFLRILYELRDKGREFGLVVIDTMNATLHGEESSAEVIAEYMRALAPVTAELGAALMITHHIRKSRDDKKISDADAMLEAIRGSAAIKDNVRVAIGVWRTPDFKRRLRLMGLPEEEKRLYCAEIVKANEPMHFGTKYLLRQSNGLLEDVSISLSQVADTTELENMAWMLKAIELYAENENFWFTKSTGATSLWNQKHLLPERIRSLEKREIIALVDKMLDMDTLVTCKVIGGGTRTASYLDTKDRQHSPRQSAGGDAGTQQINWSRYIYNPNSVEVEPLLPRHEG